MAELQSSKRKMNKENPHSTSLPKRATLYKSEGGAHMFALLTMYATI